MLKQFKELVDKLQSTSSRLEKERILRSIADNEELKKILKFLYNPYVLTGISTKKFSKEIDLEPNRAIENISDLIDYFDEHSTGMGIDIANIQHFVAHNFEYRDIIEGLVTKDLKLGVQPTTLNKVFGDDFIPTFSVMLAQKYFDSPEKYLPEGTEFSLTEKLDGCRCVCIIKNRIPKFFTRQGQPIEGLVEIENTISRFVVKGVFDGELLLMNKDNLASKDLYRATVKEVNKDGEKHNLVFNIFDVLGVEEFENKTQTLTYRERRKQLDNFAAMLEDLKSSMDYEIEAIKVLPTLYRGTDQSRIQYWLNKITNNGGEGVMINIDDALYEFKRTKNLLKVKKMQTMDLKVVGIEEGTGVNKGRLGAIKVEFPAPDGNNYIVDVGSGFTFDDRDYFYLNPEEIINKIVEIQYFEISQNEKGGYSLRFPVFLYVRNDKTEPSVF